MGVRDELWGNGQAFTAQREGEEGESAEEKCLKRGRDG